MDPTPDNLKALSSYLGQTMSPDASVRKPAEEFLKSVEAQKGFPILILTLLGSNDADPNAQTTKLAAAINFKNYIKRNWKIVIYFRILCIYIMKIFLNLPVLEQSALLNLAG